MQKYKIIKKLGSGSFGNVNMGQNKQTMQIVAIKKLKKQYGTWQQCLQLSQVKALRKMNHPNIIKLKEVIRVINQAYFVFQYIETDLYKNILLHKQKAQYFSISQIKHYTRQLIQAIQYIHKQGYIHRDLKPQNILITQDNNLKIIDFGISKQIRSKPPFTQYVSTRWYRAPQILFKFSFYSLPVDVFALGCIVAEMFLMKPLFLGQSEIDQINKIAAVLGSPNADNWPQGKKQATLKGITFPEYKQLGLSNVIHNCPSDGLDFIQQCLRWDPCRRSTLVQLYEHVFLNEQKLPNKIKQSSKQLNLKYTTPSKRKQSNYSDLDKDHIFDQMITHLTLEIEKKNSNQKKQCDEQWF